MTECEMTPWFPAKVKPIREGVYQTRCFHEGGYSYWSGSKWGSEQPTILYAISYPYFREAMQEKQWRGLASDPSGRTMKEEGR